MLCFSVAQSWVYCCIQRMQFLQPRITGHEYYGRMLEAIKSDEPIHVLVSISPAGQYWDITL